MLIVENMSLITIYFIDEESKIIKGKTFVNRSTDGDTTNRKDHMDS